MEKWITLIATGIGYLWLYVFCAFLVIAAAAAVSKKVECWQKRRQLR